MAGLLCDLRPSIIGPVGVTERGVLASLWALIQHRLNSTLLCTAESSLLRPPSSAHDLQPPSPGSCRRAAHAICDLPNLSAGCCWFVFGSRAACCSAALQTQLLRRRSCLKSRGRHGKLSAATSWPGTGALGSASLFWIQEWALLNSQVSSLSGLAPLDHPLRSRTRFIPTSLLCAGHDCDCHA